MANRFHNRFIRAESDVVASPADDVSIMQRARRARRGEPTVQKAVETEESGGLINRLRKKRRAEAKEKALDDGAFFGMRDDGKMVDGWPIK